MGIELCVRFIIQSREESSNHKKPCASTMINCSSRDQFGDSQLEWPRQLVGIVMHFLASSRNKGDGHYFFHACGHWDLERGSLL